jgi:hypothetical protein
MAAIFSWPVFLIFSLIYVDVSPELPLGEPSIAKLYLHAKKQGETENE